MMGASVQKFAGMGKGIGMDNKGWILVELGGITENWGNWNPEKLLRSTCFYCFSFRAFSDFSLYLLPFTLHRGS